MSDYLQKYSGKKIIIELASGRRIPGEVLSAGDQLISMDTGEGICTIPAGAVYIIWEPSERSVSAGTSPVCHVASEYISDGINDRINCNAFPGFTCSQNYLCSPPDNCTYSFTCPGRYTPGFPSGGGCNFYCGPFVFNQPCGPFQFQQPCAFFFGCGPFQFGNPCSFLFQCGPFQFGGSQCSIPGGFTCAGFQFAGLVGVPAKKSVEGGDTK